MRRVGRRLAGGMAVLAIVAAFAAQRPVRAATGRYVLGNVTVDDLGSFGGAGAVAWDVNNAGHIVGTAQRADGRWQAFKITGAGMADLDPFDLRSAALTINQASVAGGYAEVPWAPDREQPALFDGGGIRLVPHLLRSPAPCQWSAHVFGVNDVGQLSGSAWLEGAAGCDAVRSAVYWNTRSSRPIEHTTAGTYAQGLRLNATGIAVGTRGALLTREAFAFMGGASRTLPVLTLASGEVCASTDAYGINDGGAIVGQASCGRTSPPTTETVLWPSVTTPAQLLPRVPGATTALPRDINAQRFVVGASAFGDPVDGPSTAFLWGENLGVVALPNPGASTRCFAHAVTDLASGRLTAVGACSVPGAPSVYRAVRWVIGLRWIAVAG